MISVAMAVYNGADFLPEQLGSIAAQVLPISELVICDDCSTDNSLEIIEAFAKTVNFDVKVFRNTENKGYAKAFTRALQETTQDYVFLCDQDDVWFPEKTQVVIDEFKANPKAQLIAHNAMCTDANLKPLNKTLFEFDSIRGLVYGSAIHGFATASTRDFLNYVLPIPYSYTHDRWLALAGNELKVRHQLDKILCYYRRHEGAVSFDTIGKKESLWQIAKKKVAKNLKAFKEKRTIQNFKLFHHKTTAILNMIKKIKTTNPLPHWCDIAVLDALESEATIKEEAFQARKACIQKTGLNRLRAVLNAYKVGHYKHFKTWQTALDDLFREAWKSI